MNPKLKRTTIFLTVDQIKRLNKQAERKGLNLTQLVRVYVSMQLEIDEAGQRR